MVNEPKNIAKYITNNEYLDICNLNLNFDDALIAEIWPDYVNFEKRRTKEIPFILNNMNKEVTTQPKIFDSCLGSGATSIGLKLANLENVDSNEIDPHYEKIAKAHADKNNVNLNITNHNWFDLAQSINKKYDIVLCLGNSLTYLFDKEHRTKTIENFYKILEDQGTLIIDERNYPTILNNSFTHSGQYIYCNKDVVETKVKYATDNVVVLEFDHKLKNVKTHICVYPLKDNELHNLLENAGFKNIKKFYNYKETKDPYCEFITYVCKK